jgi:sulfur carrier protein
MGCDHLGNSIRAAMQIHVNGETRMAADGATVADLLRELQVRPDRVAVELNLEVLDRNDFEGRSLHEGDRVEIISFIGGGGGVTGVGYQVSGAGHALAGLNPNNADTGHRIPGTRHLTTDT